MHDGIVFAFLDNFDQIFPVAEVRLDEFGSRIDCFDMPRDQVIENGYFIPSVQQIFGAGAADISCSSGHKNAHGSAS